MNRNRPGCFLVGVLCLALWPGATHGQTDAPTKDDPCAAPKMKTNVRPNADGPPVEVTMGVRLTDLTEIDDVAQTLTAEYLVVLSWTDARLSQLEGCEFSLKDVWSPELIFINSGRLFSTGPKEVGIGPGGRVEYMQYYYGSLASYHHLRDFPFDKQKIVVSLVAPDWSEDDVKLVVNKQITGRRDNLNISDWKIKDVKGVIQSQYAEAFRRVHSRFDFEITADRISVFYIWKIFLPLFLIVAMSWCVFWINPAQFEPQIGLSATSMLTLIAFIFATTNMVPKVGYFTILDRFIGGSLILVFLALIQSLTTGYLVSAERGALAKRVDQICRFMFPLAFAALVLDVLLR